MRLQTVPGSDDLFTSAKYPPGITVALNTSILRLQDGSLLIYGPSKNLGNDYHQELLRHGTPRYLIAPNHFHYLGQLEWRERYPDAVSICAQAARKRILKKTGIAMESPDTVAQLLPKGATLLEAQGSRSGEMWLQVPTQKGPLWAVGDAFFHISQLPPGWLGPILRWSKSGPNLALGQTYIWLQIRDKNRYKSWVLNTIAAQKPRLLLPSHGELLDDPNLSEHLRVLVEHRL